MINLLETIAIQVKDDKTGLDPAHFYRVIGTQERKYSKDGKDGVLDLFIVIKPDGFLATVYPNECKVRRLDTIY